MKGQESKVCKLLKSLYGLKQAPKQWHEKFDRTLTSAAFVINEADRCVYYRYGGGAGVILYLYVDDILIFDTYLSVARLTTIRALLSLVASYCLIVHQMDVKTTFLNGELDEEIYMDQPDGFVVMGQESKVCKLLKSLYGLK